MLTVSLSRASRLQHIFFQTNLQTRGVSFEMLMYYSSFFTEQQWSLTMNFLCSSFHFYSWLHLYLFINCTITNMYVFIVFTTWLTWLMKSWKRVTYIYSILVCHGYEGKKTLKTYKFTTLIWNLVSVCA